MKPILYGPNETAFDTNGIGVLTDAVECRVVAELNGQYELTLRYPITGVHYKDLVRRAIILAKPDPVSDPQPFRIYRRGPSSQGTITVYARHIAYDLKGIVVSPFCASGAPAALQSLNANAVNDCPFTFWTDKTTGATMTVAVPSAVWRLLGGSAGSVLDVFGGEYEFDRFTVKLWNRRGADRGVSIRYGKNLTSLEQDENISNTYTGVYPYWQDTEGNLVQLTEKIVNVPGTFDHVRIMPLDLSTEWQEAPSEAQLRDRAAKYIADNDIGTPPVSWTVKHVDLAQTEEYKGKAILEQLLMGDTVAVEFADMDVSASSRVVATDFDVLAEIFNSATLGSVKANIADTIVQQGQQIQSKPSQSAVQSAILQLTAAIIGAKGGSTRLLDTNGDGLPDELYIADNPNPAQAVKVWRFNYEGWAASKTGYNGPFVLGASLDGGILADFITAGTLYGMLIKAGAIESADGKIKIDLSDGTAPIFNTGISTNGITVRADEAEQPDLFVIEVRDHTFQNGTVGKTAVIRLRSAAGHGLWSISETWDARTLEPVGVTTRAANKDKSRGYDLYAYGNQVGFALQTGDVGSSSEAVTKGRFYFGSQEVSVLECDTVNPGKKTLFSGSCAVGGSFSVGTTGTLANTHLYDLFAVRLGDDGNTSQTVVLAYKVGGVIRGVGGWAGTSTDAKQLYFFSASFSGDTWTVQDAGVHTVNYSGGIGAGTRLQVKEVIGII